MATFWITKFALTRGVYSIEAKDPAKSIFPDTLPVGGLENIHGEGRDWHRTRESAVARAEEMRVAKIASLSKQIARFEKLSFDKDSQP